MERMERNQEARLDALFAEYRAACPDPEASSNFMPGLWLKIEQRRRESVFVFRRLAQGFVMTAMALVLIMAVVIPRIQGDFVSLVSYTDVVDAEDGTDMAEVLMSGDSL